MAANKESLFKIGQNVLSNTVNTGRNLLNKVDFANIVPDPTPEQIEADYINRIGNFAQPVISKGSEVLQGLGDFAQQSVQPGVDAQGEPIMVDGVQQQQGFLRPLIDYAKSPEGTQMLADLARLGVAATRKDPIVAGTMAKSLSDDLAQRPIQAAQRKKAAQDEEMFDLNKLLKLTQIEALGAKPQADADKVAKATSDKEISAFVKNERALMSKGIKPIKKSKDLDNVPDEFIRTDTDPRTGKEVQYIDQVGLSERKKEVDQIVDYRKNLLKKNRRLLKNQIDKLITDVDGQTKLTKVGDQMRTNPYKKGIDRFFSQDFRDMEAIVKTLKANLGFDALQAMRDASPTGGALGQVSERELDFLQSAAGSLDVGMSRDALIQNIKEIRSSLERLNGSLVTDKNAILMGDGVRENENVRFRRVD